MFDIVFISYNEPNADENWHRLLSRFPFARRISGVEGIHEAHKAAASVPGTQHFWVVDGDSTVDDSFDFTPPNDIWINAVYVYRARNPVNGLSYGYGGIKLLPRKETANMELGNIDMTTSISGNFFPIDQIASTTNFNTDPFNTWKSAFRECVKLSSKIIDKQVDKETEERLDVWCQLNENVPYGAYAYIGANQGREYGVTNSKDADALARINDFDCLQQQFNLLMQRLSTRK